MINQIDSPTFATSDTLHNLKTKVSALLSTRTSFSWSFSDLLYSLIPKCFQRRRPSPSSLRQERFDLGVQKLLSDLDVVEVLTHLKTSQAFLALQIPPLHLSLLSCHKTFVIPPSKPACTKPSPRKISPAKVHALSAAVATESTEDDLAVLKAVAGDRDFWM